MNAAESINPMALPFKVANFQLHRWKELRDELGGNPLFARLENKSRAPALANYCKAVDQGFLVPHGAHAALDEALHALRTIARLSLNLSVRARAGDVNAPTSLASREGNTLFFNLPAVLLEGRSAAELLYHLAVATFFAMDTTPRVVLYMMRQRMPFQLRDRLIAYELIRLAEYAADCFALTCTGDLELTLREGFFRSGAAGRSRPQLDLRALARHHLEAGDLTMTSLIETGRIRFDHAVLLPLVLEQFQASEIYRTCRGLSGGVPRADFEDAVLELDRKAHPPMKSLPQSHDRFIRKTILLAAFALTEAGAPMSSERKTELLETINMEPGVFDQLAAECDLDWQVPGAAANRLEALLLSRREQEAHLHVVDLLFRCLALAIREYGAEFPEAVDELIFDIGEWSCLTASEVNEIRLALAQLLLGDSEERDREP